MILLSGLDAGQAVSYGMVMERGRAAETSLKLA